MLRRRLRPDRDRPRPRRGAVRGGLPHPRRPRLLRRGATASESSTGDGRAAATPREAVEVLRSRELAGAVGDTSSLLDPRYGTISVTAWHGMHPRCRGRGHWAGFDRPPIVRGSVIRVDVEHLPKPTSRAKKTFWLWWSGDGEPDLDRCVACVSPALRHRAHVPVREADPRLDDTEGPDPGAGRPLVISRRRRAHRASPRRVASSATSASPGKGRWTRRKLTPCRVRRGFRRLRATLGTPASMNVQPEMIGHSHIWLNRHH